MIPPPASVRRILVRANNWIGDVVMISPAVRALREHFTGAEIAILARPWVLDALAANPCFDRPSSRRRPNPRMPFKSSARVCS